MIIGIGTDIVAVSRIAAALERRGDALAERLLHPQELALWQQSQQPAAWLAKRFAAKEALLKALGTGLAEGISWQDLMVLPNHLGRPVATWQGRAHEYLQQLANGQTTRTHLSIADEQEQAVAFAIIESCE